MLIEPFERRLYIACRLLAGLSRENRLKRRELAKLLEIDARDLERPLHQLGAAKLVHAVPGPTGGVKKTFKGGQATAGDVLAALCDDESRVFVDTMYSRSLASVVQAMEAET